LHDNTTTEGRENRRNDRHAAASTLRTSLSNADLDSGEATVTVSNAHLSLLREGTLRQVSVDGSYRPSDRLHRAVIGRVETHGYQFAGYRDLSISVGVGVDGSGEFGEATFTVEIKP
jgi:hypothetical protein